MKRVVSTHLWARHCIVFAALLVVLVLTMGTQAQAAGNFGKRMQAAPQTNALVVRRDPGGRIGERQRQVAALLASDRRVEIVGKCYSSCTMYLALDNVCISPKAEFGFHGPSKNGRPLDDRNFEYWSAVMSAGYPQALQREFMSRLRYKINGVYKMSGANLIAMGYEPCL